MVNGVPTPMTQAEETARDAEEAAWTAGDAARIAVTARMSGLDAAIAADQTLQSFKSMTATQFDTWWDANVTNAAQVVAVLKRLVKLVVRRLL